MSQDDRQASTQLSLEARFAAAAPTEPRPLTVSEVVGAARGLLEARFRDLHVEGEIAGCSRSAAGHFYFRLKDATATLECTLFKNEARAVTVKPIDGQLVRVRGALTIWPERGKFYLRVAAIEPAGAGALAAAFEALKEKLRAEGLFDRPKRPLPFLPRRIGVVTSAQGAVIRDIIRVTQRRYPVPILLAPAPVQGAGAAAQLAAALDRLARVPDVDVIIVARGGGSLEDLWAFNDEALARAIAACARPVISAVGHETDFTIADFVADRRASTPSQAGELVVPERQVLADELASARQRLRSASLHRLGALRHTLRAARDGLGDPRRLLDDARQSLDDLIARAAGRTRDAVAIRRKRLQALQLRLASGHPQRRILERRAWLDTAQEGLRRAGAALLSTRRHALERASGKLETLSPLRVLERGYSLTRDRAGRLVTDAAQVAGGTEVTITLRRGALDARITAARPPDGATPEEA